MSDPGLHAGSIRAESSTVEQELPTGDYVESKREDGLTVLIRGRNHRASLPHALRSALDGLDRLEEEGFSAEIVVIDDASFDGSQKLLRSVQALYGEPRLRALCLGRSFGRSGLRDLGLQVSAFRYVCIMDADNELMPANLPLFLRSVVDTGAAMVYGNVLEKEGEEVVGVRSNMPVIPRLLKARRIDVFSVVDARKLSNVEGTAVDPHSPEGWNMALRLLAEGELVVFVPAVLGYHHERSTLTSERPQLSDSRRTTPQRVHARTGTRELDGARIGRLYHPEVGFLDE